MDDFLTVVWALRYWLIGVAVFLVAFCAAEKIFETPGVQEPLTGDDLTFAREQYRRYTKEDEQ